MDYTRQLSNELYPGCGAGPSFACSLAVSVGVFQTDELCCCESVECSVRSSVVTS